MPYDSLVYTISGISKLIEGFGIAKIELPNRTQLTIEDALYSSRIRRNLLSFKDIRHNNYHSENSNINNNKF